MVGSPTVTPPGWPRPRSGLRCFDHVRAAWETGRLSGGQVTAIVANITDRTAALFAEGEADLVDTLTHLDVTDTTTVMQEWAAKADAIADETEPPEPKPNTLHHSAPSTVAVSCRAASMPSRRDPRPGPRRSHARL